MWSINPVWSKCGVVNLYIAFSKKKRGPSKVLSLEQAVRYVIM